MALSAGGSGKGLLPPPMQSRKKAQSFCIALTALMIPFFSLLGGDGLDPHNTGLEKLVFFHCRDDAQRG